jgi:Uma2 family endonuclease
MIASQTPITEPRARFTPEQYIYLSENNMLGTGRTELIHGEIIKMCSQFDLHVYGVTEINDQLRKAFPKPRFWVRSQSTLHCGDSMPEPDVAVVSGPMSAERTIMRGERALLVVEVSDTTLDADLNVKPAIYASVGIPEYWVLDLNARALIVHRGPVKSGRMGPRYKSITIHDRASKVAPLSAPKRTIRIATLVG